MSDNLLKAFEKVDLNKFGFYELKDKPTEEELEGYYRNKYYQQSGGTYQKEYQQNEITFFLNRINRKYQVVKNLKEINIGSFLDIGCGQGWALKFFHEKGWKVRGLDYSIEGCLQINPDLVQYVTQGNIYDNLNLLAEQRNKFDVMLVDNVLEHVLDPLNLVTNLKELVAEEGILIIESPNDFSKLQLRLLETGKIKDPFWVVIPDHISYFNINGLQNMMSETGWETAFIGCDYPIDFNLFNDNTNYNTNKELGKSVHDARLEIENFLDEISVQGTNELYSKMAQMGLGRNLIGFFRVVK